MARKSSFLSLTWNDDARAVTRKSRRRESAFSTSTVTPSAKYCCLGSDDRLSNGSTATDRCVMAAGPRCGRRGEGDDGHDRGAGDNEKGSKSPPMPIRMFAASRRVGRDWYRHRRGLGGDTLHLLDPSEALDVLDAFDGNRESIASLRNRFDVARPLRHIVERLPQLSDGEVYRTITDGDTFPDRCDDVFDGDDGPLVSREVDQHVHRARLDPDRSRPALEQIEARCGDPVADPQSQRVAHKILKRSSARAKTFLRCAWRSRLYLRSRHS